ncbi:MAG: SRPBCC family protein [bacterium]
MVQWIKKSGKEFYFRNKMALPLMCILTSVLLASPCFPAEKVLDEKLDKNTLKLMAQHGQLIHLAYDGEELTYRTVVMFVNAPVDMVWDVITDIENYDKFVPEMLPPKIINRKKDEITAHHTVKVKVIAGISASENYDMRYVFKKPRVYMYDPKKPKREPGYWEIVPVDGSSKTLLFYTDRAPNLNEMGTMVKTIVRMKPELGLALQVSPISILTKAMKSRAEALAKKK